MLSNTSSLNGSSLKLVDKFTNLGSSVSSTETDINTWQVKAWTAIDWLSVIWKSNLTDKLKRSFFQAAVVSILLYECTTWILTKRMEKKLDGNYTRMLWAILNTSWRQYPTKQYPPPTSVLDMTLNNLMVRFQQCWSFGECGVPLHCHRSQVYFGPEW